MPHTISLHETSSQDESQVLGFSADCPISIASPASTVTYCESVSEYGTDQLEADSDAGLAVAPTNLENSLLPATEITATTPPSPIDNGRFRALMREYEQIISGHAEPNRSASPGELIIGAHNHPEAHCRVPPHEGSEKSEASAPKRAPQRKRLSTKRPRRQKGGKGRAEGRVRKKCASAKTTEAYEFLRLGGARRAERGRVEYEVVWAPTWLTVEDLQGKEAIKEAEELVVHLFGRGMWHEEERKLG